MDEILDNLWLLPFVLARVLVFVRVLPFMGSEVIPPMVLTGFSLSLAPLTLPLIMAGAPSAPVSALVGAALILKEMILGFVFGFLAALLFWAVMSMGFLFDNQRGASQGDVQDPLSQEQTSPFGAFFFQWCTLLFCGSGALTLFLGAFVESYAWWPVFELTPPLKPDMLFGFFLHQTSWFFRITITLAAPVLAIYFLTDFSLGLVNRFAQQLNVYTLAMPVKSGVLMILLVVYMGILQHVLMLDLLRLPEVFTRLRSVWYGL